MNWKTTEVRQWWRGRTASGSEAAFPLSAVVFVGDVTLEGGESRIEVSFVDGAAPTILLGTVDGFLDLLNFQPAPSAEAGGDG